MIFFWRLNISVSPESARENSPSLQDCGLLVKVVYRKLFMFQVIFKVIWPRNEYIYCRVSVWLSYEGRCQHIKKKTIISSSTGWHTLPSSNTELFRKSLEILSNNLLSSTAAKFWGITICSIHEVLSNFRNLWGTHSTPNLNI